MTEDRRSGRTSRQMLEAPKNAYYVWPYAALDYPKKLAHHLGRDDLTVVDAYFFSYRMQHNKRMRVKIILDHGCVLTVSQMTDIQKCNVLEEA